ncbi:hypothetical protein [Defluviimonas salinarum]|uniref:Uncharacterized protein n=1 Tax=Defluviimonas salinarum TaxID=2992147 RepID=A0ABT3J898_9RHOB|nr:hypothetical protein [Defluviimonas salinarum]MCW3783899.1 hypothetical protein [Defluviimonas salinarum]
MSRARRRADLARMKKKARRVYPHDAQAKNADHLCTCSCLVCGNPRRHWGEIRPSERRALEAGREE